jgi:hypothetical protein
MPPAGNFCQIVIPSLLYATESVFFNVLFGLFSHFLAFTVPAPSFTLFRQQPLVFFVCRDFFLRKLFSLDWWDEMPYKIQMFGFHRLYKLR